MLALELPDHITAVLHIYDVKTALARCEDNIGPMLYMIANDLCKFNEMLLLLDAFSWEISRYNTKQLSLTFVLTSQTPKPWPLLPNSRHFWYARITTTVSQVVNRSEWCLGIYNDKNYLQCSSKTQQCLDIFKHHTRNIHNSKFPKQNDEFNFWSNVM